VAEAGASGWSYVRLIDAKSSASDARHHDGFIRDRRM
jgi:hypothetical protein